MSAANPTPGMPARGHATAPKFDPKQPRELRRYFEELELLFATANITGDDAKKKQARRYLDIDSAELWQTLPEFDHQHTYIQFTEAVYKLYPGSEDERKWSIADMDKLVTEQHQSGITDASALGIYHRGFLTITQFLRAKSRLSEAEQSRAFVRGFQKNLWQRIARRLELKFPDHYPDDPYPLADIHEAAKFVLHGTSPAVFQAEATATTSSTTSLAGMKSEDLTAFLDRFATTLVTALDSRHTAAPPPLASGSAPTLHSSTQPPPSGCCNFCGAPGHYMHSCPHCATYIRDGKCLRNQDGKIVLPNGTFCPRSIVGQYLRERIDEWHRQNPGNIVPSGATMMLQVGPSPQMNSLEHNYRSILRLNQADTNSTPQLSATDRIAALEYEILTLRNRQRFDGVVLPSKRPAPAPAAAPPATVVPAPSVAPQLSAAPTSAPATAPAEPPSAPATSQPANSQPTTSPPEQPPVHPFAKAAEPNYLPPHDRVFAAPPKPAKERDGAYTVQAPIEDPQIAGDVYMRWLRMPNVTLSPEELLSLSPDLRNKVREAVTTKRIPVYKTKLNEINNIGDALPFSDGVLDPDLSAAVTSSPLIIPDPYEAYLSSLRAGQEPEVLTVAKESHALRSISMLVDNKENVEAILDPGSQIIAMSEDVCHDLGLPYDPSIRLNMQSANGTVDRSLGLARNVPCRIGTITVYLQIHVIRAPAYDILLGRPFDVLTESTVKNFANADQTITVRDPNRGITVTIPTMPRGLPRHMQNECPGQGFHVR
jgi:gag-polyprotein putative aspartyl protease